MLITKDGKIEFILCFSSSRPDIFLYSKELKRVLLVEFTVTWETNIPKDHALKTNKYYDLKNDLTKNGFVVNLYAVEVGARGIPAKSLYNLLKDLGLSIAATSSLLERISKAALAGSYQIWLGRERKSSSDQQFPRDLHMMEKWLNATGRTNWMPTKLSTICSKHFDAKHFIVKRSGYRYLSDKAEPTLHIVRYYVQNQTTIKEEPQSDSDIEEPPEIPNDDIDIKIDPDSIRPELDPIQFTYVSTNDNPVIDVYDTSHYDTTQEQRLKSMVRGRNEVIRKQSLKIKQLQSKLLRLRKMYAMVEGELKQIRVQDEETGVVRKKFVYSEPPKPKKPDIIEFIRV